MEQSADITELAKAIAAFQAAMTPVEKSADNPFFRSKYADLASVMKQAMPLTSKEGISIVQFPGLAEGAEVLYTQLSHTSGQWMRSCMKLHLTKNDAQGQGSALTYAKRYAAMAALGIVADEDDDGNAASKQKSATVSKIADQVKAGVGSTKPKQEVELAKTWDINNIKIAARKVTGLSDDVELVAWIEETLEWPLAKLPKSKVAAAIDKIKAGKQVFLADDGTTGGELGEG
jgi:hypothetical protein